MSVSVDDRLPPQGVLDVVVKAWSQFRRDGWYNPFTGFGSAIDANTHTQFLTPVAVNDATLTALFYGNPIARKIVKIYPDEMLREGIEIQGDNGKEIRKVAGDIGLFAGIQEGMTWGRLYGGSIMVLGADDGRAPEKPLAEDAVKSLTWVKVYDKRRLFIERKYTDEMQPKYGEPEIYRINHLNGDIKYVHESRCIRFHGLLTGEQEQQALQGWDYSVLQVVWDALQRFGTSEQAATNLLADASTAVFKIKGLIGMLSRPQGLNDMATRAQLMNMGRSVARAVFLDADSDEAFDKVPTQFSGVSDMLDRFANYLAAATEIPVTILMGQAPAGLNATGASDIRVFYDRIASEQETTLRPILRRCLNILGKAMNIKPPEGEEHAFTFRPLWQETPAEREERRNKVAQTDAIYLTNDVLTPEIVRRNRFMGEEWSPETEIEEDEAPKDIVNAFAQPDPTKELQAKEATPVDDGKPKLPVTPSDAATVLRVDEVRKDLKQSPIGEGEGGNLFLPEWKAKFAPVIAEAAAAEAGKDAPTDANAPKPAPFGPSVKAPPEPSPEDDLLAQHQAAEADRQSEED